MNKVPCVLRLLLFPVLSVALACQASPSPTPSQVLPQTLPAPTDTITPPPKPTAIRTPPSLPGPYQSRYLNPLDSVQTYVDNTCEYLRNRWDSRKAAPGTVVMIIMLHSINRRKGEGPEAMTAGLFGRMMHELQDQSFQAINMQQLAGFLESNARIPFRSVMFIQDGRHYPENFNTHFRPYWDEWGWSVVSAWDHQGSTTEGLWVQYKALEDEGLVDFQVYGPTFGAADTKISDEYLKAQLQKAINEHLKHFGKAPAGVVWPSGFSAQAARIARQLGYRLGFTFNPRGPLMYNWVPLSSSSDSFRPSFRPETSVNDPLMTLPRYWPHQVHDALDSVRIVGKEAAAYAAANKAIEMEYYDVVCEKIYGSIPN